MNVHVPWIRQHPNPNVLNHKRIWIPSWEVTARVCTNHMRMPSWAEFGHLVPRQRNPAVLNWKCMSTHLLSRRVCLVRTMLFVMVCNSQIWLYQNEEPSESSIMRSKLNWSSITHECPCRPLLMVEVMNSRICCIDVRIILRGRIGEHCPCEHQLNVDVNVGWCWSSRSRTAEASCINLEVIMESRVDQHSSNDR